MLLESITITITEKPTRKTQKINADFTCTLLKIHNAKSTQKPQPKCEIF